MHTMLCNDSLHKVSTAEPRCENVIQVDYVKSKREIILSCVCESHI